MFNNDFIERRQTSRMTMACPVVIRHPAKEYRERIRNLSADGLKLETNNTLSVNGKYNFEFTLPEGPSMRLEGEVRWRHPKGNAVYYGIQFRQIGLIPRLRLKLFLNRRLRDLRKARTHRHGKS